MELYGRRSNTQEAARLIIHQETPLDRDSLIHHLKEMYGRSGSTSDGRKMSIDFLDELEDTPMLVDDEGGSGQSTISGGRSPTRQIQGQDTYDSEEDTGLSVAGVSSQVQWVLSSPDSHSDNMIQDGGDDNNAYDGEEDNDDNGPTEATRPIKQDRQNKTSRILVYDLLGQLLVDSHNGSGRPNG